MSKVYCDAYDPVQQSKGLEDGFAPTVQDYHARLRLDAFLSGGSIVLTDAQIFDGPVFLDIAVKGQLEALPAPHLNIVARAKTLEEAFLQFIVPYGADKPKNLLLSALPQEYRKLVWEELPKYKARNIRHWKDYLTALRTIQVKDDVVDKLGEGLERWFKFDKVRVQEWDQGFEWQTKLGKKLTTTSSYAYLDTTQSAGIHKALDNVLKMHGSGSNRADIVAELDKFVSQTDSESDEHKDIYSIKDWFNRCYNETAALQHGCNGIGTSLESRGTRLLRMLNLTDHKISELLQDEQRNWLFPIPVQEEFSVHLANMPIQAYHALQDEQRYNISLWREKNDNKALTTAVRALVETAQRTGGGYLNSSFSSNMLKAGYMVVSGGAGVATFALLHNTVTTAQAALASMTAASFGLGAISRLNDWLSPARRSERRILEIATTVRR